MPTPTEKLAGIAVGRPIQGWIADRRAEGRSWRLIARDLYETTGGEIDVTYETLRAWSYEQTDRASA